MPTTTKAITTRPWNTTMVYDNQNDLDKALEYFNKSLLIREKLFGPDDAKVKETKEKIAAIQNKK